jgi:NADH dehydrogenase
MSFAELVALVRGAVNARSPIVHMPPSLMAAAARALGLFVRDVVLTPDEIKGLTAGLLVSHEDPRGQIAFSRWLEEHKASVGRAYANELHRHFATKAAA